jgi:hypothetical protein
MSPNVNPLETLMAEHRQIERVLAALEACARQIEGGEQVAPSSLARFARFLRSYADELHHGKEEELLFEKMVAAGFPREAGPVAVMRLEHERGRALVRELKAAGREGRVDRGGPAPGGELPFEFAAALRGHILKRTASSTPWPSSAWPPSRWRPGEECRAHVQEPLEAESDLLEAGPVAERGVRHRDQAHARGPPATPTTPPPAPSGRPRQVARHTLPRRAPCA